MYQVAYDALNEGQPLGNYLILFGWIIGLFVGFRLCRKAFEDKDKFGMPFMMFWMAFWVLVGGFGTINVFYVQDRCLKWRESGEYSITEGTVEDFDPMPYQGHKKESFRLGKYKFSYSDYSRAKGCFNNTLSHGGPIQSGSKVRLYHNEGVILRVEVWRA